MIRTIAAVTPTATGWGRGRSASRTPQDHALGRSLPRAGGRRLRLLIGAALLPACTSFVPLSEPPSLASDDAVGRASTRAEVIARLGRPAEVRASDDGEILIYRRSTVVSGNPNRYYGEDRGARLDRYERIFVYLDPDGRVVRWVAEPE